MAPRLPLEVLLRVIDSLTPSSAVALVQSHPNACLTRSFMLVCRATYPVAVRLLYKHCLWINSSEKLRRLILALNAHLDSQRRLISSLPWVSITDSLTNLYLAPFDRNTIDDLPTAQWVFELFAMMRSSLQRLVIDMPLRSVYPESDHLDVRPKLRAAFQELTAVKEFTSVRDELYLSVQPDWVLANDEVPVWARWQDLRRLALYNIDLGSPAYVHLDTLVYLENMVLTNADGLDSLESWSEFSSHLVNSGTHIIVLGNVSRSKITSRMYTPLKDMLSDSGVSSLCHDDVKVISILTDETANLEWQDAAEWVKTRATEGTLWNYGMAAN